MSVSALASCTVAECGFWWHQLEFLVAQHVANDLSDETHRGSTRALQGVLAL